MSGWVDRLGATLLDAGLAATAISGLVVLAMLQCRQPARRRGWARAGLLSSLALLPLAALNPVPRVDLRIPIRDFFTNPPDHFKQPNEQEFPDFSPYAIGPSVEDCHDHGPVVSPLRRVCQGLVGLYLLGLSIGLAWIVLGLAGTCYLIRNGRIPAPKSIELFESLPFSRGPSKPRLLVSDRLSRPVLVSLSRPVILIPANLDEPTEAVRLRLSLLHELAHAENLDHRFSPVATLTQALWFFLPTLWWIRDQMKLDQEFLADRRAVANFGSSGSYASSLVSLAKIRDDDPVDCPKTVVFGSPISVAGVASALVQRVQMLLKCPFPIEEKTPVWWRFSTALTLSLATIAASCLTIRGLGGWLTPSQSSSIEPTQTFRIPQITLGPLGPQEPTFNLRYRLPHEFTLSLEVMAEPDDLPLIELLGYPLNSSAADPQNRGAYHLWHRVTLRRIQGFDFLEVDGRSIFARPLTTPSSSWLTIRPLPAKPTRIRDLLIEWSL